VSGRPDFNEINAHYTSAVVADVESAGLEGAVLVEAPPGAGKSSLTVSVAAELVARDKKLRLPIVTQTNEQADDLVVSLRRKHPEVGVARMVAGSGPSAAMLDLADDGLVLASKIDDQEVLKARIVVATARKWEYVRSGMQKNDALRQFHIGLIDEAYQMRSDALLGIAPLFERLMCVGDPGQLAPFTTVDDSLWKGLEYSPARTAMGTLRAYHPDIDPHQLPTSWRLPPSAAPIVSQAFYPFSPFDAGTLESQRALDLGKAKGKGSADDQVLERAASDGWAYVELPEKFAVRTDGEIASRLAALVHRLLERGAIVTDELEEHPKALTPGDVAVVAAHNDQVHAVRYALDSLGVDPDSLVVSTANKVQGREYEVVLVWHPLAGRRDATAFHLEAGRMCVMVSRHRQACIVVGRAGATRLLDEFPDAEPIFLDEPEKFPDGWEANGLVLDHLAGFRTG